VEESDVVEGLRADAQHNHDRLLEAAGSAFARDGAEASLKAIAAEAGVGIGTLYRRFPTREALYIAVHRREIARIAERAAELSALAPPAEALRQWLGEFAGFLRAKEGMAEVFRAVMAAGENPFLDLRVLVRDALDGLLTAAAGAGIRRDLDAGDVLVAVHGLTLATTDADQLDRLVGLVVAGLRA
jgi:AcrR family transcriptional regulator